MIPADEERRAKEVQAILDELKSVIKEYCDSSKLMMADTRINSSKEMISKSKKLIERSRVLMHAVKVYQENPGCIMKACSCGKEYRPTEWFELPFVGYQSLPIIGGEMRNCACNSTLLVIIYQKRAA